MMKLSGAIVARRVCVWNIFDPVIETYGWFLLVQELNDKPLGFVSTQGCD